VVCGAYIIYIFCILGLPLAPHILLVYKSADQGTLEYSGEVDATTVLNKTEIMLNKDELYIKLGDQTECVNWIITLKLVVTKCMLFASMFVYYKCITWVKLRVYRK